MSKVCLSFSLQDANTEPEAVNITQGSLPVYRLTVENTGNVDLTDVTLVDSINGELGTFTDFAVGQIETVGVLGDPQSGVGTVFFNAAYATGKYGTKEIRSKTDKAYCKVVAA
jgi:uncharacterized repeat protein (TIGR01451 family)